MKKAIAAGLILLGALTLTGCGDSFTYEEQYKYCIDHGGSYIEDGWGDSCVMPEYKPEDKDR